MLYSSSFLYKFDTIQCMRKAAWRTTEASAEKFVAHEMGVFGELFYFCRMYNPHSMSRQQSKDRSVVNSRLVEIWIANERTQCTELEYRSTHAVKCERCFPLLQTWPLNSPPTFDLVYGIAWLSADLQQKPLFSIAALFSTDIYPIKVHLTWTTVENIFSHFAEQSNVAVSCSFFHTHPLFISGHYHNTDTFR